MPTDEELGRRVGERLTIRLEDRIRDRSALDRERAARFIPTVRQLVEDGEPELLAMLLDEAYRASLNETAVAPEPEEADEPDEASDDAPEGADRRGLWRQRARR